QIYNVFHIPPTISSIVALDTNPTDADTVRYFVQFSGPVNNVDAGDFQLEPTGTLAGFGITSVSGAGSSYTVAVSTGTGQGTLRLNLIDNDTITDPAGNKFGGDGQQNVTGALYTIDREAPSVQSITLADPVNQTPGATVRFTVTFSESVTGVVAEDFL